LQPKVLPRDAALCRNI